MVQAAKLRGHRRARRCSPHVFGCAHGRQETCYLLRRCNNSGSMLPPLITATAAFDCGRESRRNIQAAGAAAPLGSARVWGFAARILTASEISSSVTVTM